MLHDFAACWTRCKPMNSVPQRMLDHGNGLHQPQAAAKLVATAMYRNPALFRCTGVCSTSSMSCQTLCFYIALLHQRRQFGQNRLRAEAFPCFSCHLRLQSLLRQVCSSFWRVPRVAQLRHRRCSPSPETTVFGRICRHERHSNHPFLARVESRFASSWQSLQARPSTGKVTMLG